MLECFQFITLEIINLTFSKTLYILNEFSTALWFFFFFGPMPLGVNAEGRLNENCFDTFAERILRSV